MLNIEQPGQYKIAIHHLGFRPMFLVATLFSVVSVLIWFWLYHFDVRHLLHSSLDATTWHAHEMIFGYTLGVIAGFLLTAVRNWTNIQTVHGTPLILLALLWLTARVLPFFHFSDALFYMAFSDLSFNIFFLIAITIPVIKSRSWGQLGILVIVLLLGIMNGIFYLGLLDQDTGGMQTGRNAGLYLCVLLVMIMARRVIPFFIEKGVDVDVSIRNRNWLDISSIVLMLMFILFDVFLQLINWAVICASILFILQLIRLYDWHTPGIWKKPLLWSLYLAYAFLTLGFLYKAMASTLLINPMLSTHAFAYGGIGLVTLSMMSRVTLGHTGRNVFQPPASLQWLFLVFVIGVASRVILPLFLSEHYSILIGISQLLWVIAFSGFLLVFVRMWILPRVDGRFG